MSHRPSHRFSLPFACALLCASTGCNGPTANTTSDGDGGAPDLALRVFQRMPPRADFASGFDATGKQLVLFGGDDGMEVATVLHPHYHDDTFRFDQASGAWVPSQAHGPSARGRAAFAMDTKRRRLVVALGRFRPEKAGSVLPYTLLDDAWGYDVAGDAWSQLSTNGTAPTRAAMVTVYDPDGDRLVLFGGDTSTSFDIFQSAPSNETWQLDLASGAWSKVQTQGKAPSPRTLAAGALDRAKHRLLVFGGVDAMGGFLADLWALDLKSGAWTLLDSGASDSAPSGRIGASAATVPGAFVVFGGHDLGAAGNLNDAFIYTDTNGWKLAIAGDMENNTTLGCAGNKSEQPYDFVTPAMNTPERRERAALVATSDALLLFGGEGDCAQLDDTWSFTFDTGASAFRWTKLLPAAHGESCLRRGDQCPCLCE